MFDFFGFELAQYNVFLTFILKISLFLLSSKTKNNSGAKTNSNKSSKSNLEVKNNHKILNVNRLISLFYIY